MRVLLLLRPRRQVGSAQSKRRLLARPPVACLDGSTSAAPAMVAPSSALKKAMEMAEDCISLGEEEEVGGEANLQHRI